MVTSGCQCPKCRSGQMFIGTSKQSGEYQLRYLKCSKCDNDGRQVVRCEMVLRRAARIVTY